MRQEQHNGRGVKPAISTTTLKLRSAGTKPVPRIKAQNTPLTGVFLFMNTLANRSYRDRMHYVYIIQSIKDESFYTGNTKNLQRRLSEHNRGLTLSTKTKIPYRFVWYCAFIQESKAILFEKYLKTGSGIAFARKRLL